jgi:hypothetical protein
VLLRCVALLAIALLPRPAVAGFDLTIQAIFTPSFTPDRVVDFDDFDVGEILEAGEFVAPGVTFGGAAGATLQQAIVVDLGGGNHALRQVNLGSAEAPVLTDIAFTFAAPARSVGADADATGNATNLFPQARCYGGGDYLNFVSVGGTVNSFFGFEGQAASTPIDVLVYDYATDEPAIGMTIDDLANEYAPEPRAAVMSAAALACVATRASRRSRRA